MRRQCLNWLRKAGALDALEADVAALEAAMSESADLRDMISSPIYGREETQGAVGGIADAMGLDAITGNTLRLMAQKRRLFVLPALLRALRERIADHKGEVTADVLSAKGSHAGAVRQAEEGAVGIRGPRGSTEYGRR